MKKNRNPVIVPLLTYVILMGISFALIKSAPRSPSRKIAQVEVKPIEEPSFFNRFVSSLKDTVFGLPADGVIEVNKVLVDSNGIPFGKISQNVNVNSPTMVDSDGSFSQKNEPGLRSSGQIQEFPTKNERDAEGVIVVMTEPSELKTRSVSIQQRRSLPSVNQSIDDQRNAILTQQSRIKNKLIGKMNVSLDRNSIRRKKGVVRIREFKKAINAIAFLDVSLSKAREIFKNDPDVKSIHPNVKVKADLYASVPQTQVNQVWSIASANGSMLDGTGMRIGVLDTGTDYTHPDLGGCLGPNCKVIGGYDFVNNDSNPMDDHGHGTHVAATVAGSGTHTKNDGTVVPLLGTAPGAKLYAFKILDRYGSGSSSAIIAAIEACADPNNDGNYADHLDVCSMSLGGPGNPDDPMSVAVDASTANGVLFVIAAGNSGPTAGTVQSPGAARSAITVAASCKTADIGSDSYCSTPIARFSSVGPVTWTQSNGTVQTIQKPDIAAPGHKICAAQFGTYQSTSSCGPGRIAISGTSMATPHMAGIAAIIRQAHPEFTPEQVKQIIKQSARNLGVSAAYQGAGEVSAYDALLLSGLPNSILSLTGVPLIVSDPVTQNQQTFIKTLNIRNISNSVQTITPSFTSDQAGISAFFDTPSLQLNPGASAPLSISFNLDHTKLNTPSTLNGTLKLAVGGTEIKLGTIFQLSSRLNSSLAKVDLGLNSASLSSFSANQSLTINNTISDAPASYSVSLVCCGINSPSGNNAISATPSSSTLNIPAGGSSVLNLSFLMQNAQLTNGRYNGYLRLVSSLETLEIPITFYKGYGFKVQYGQSESSIKIQIIRRSNNISKSSYFEKSGEAIFLVPDYDSYDFISVYFGENNKLLTTVIKEDIKPNSGFVDVNLSKSEATIESQMKPINENGGILSSAFYVLTIGNTDDQPNFIGSGILGATYSSDGVYRILTNTFSSLHQIQIALAKYGSSPSYSFDYYYKGIQQPSLRTNVPSDLTLRKVSLVQNTEIGKNPSLSYFQCAMGFGGSFCMSWGSGQSASANNPINLYSYSTGLSQYRDLSYYFTSRKFMMSHQGGGYSTDSDYYIFDQDKSLVFRSLSLQYPLYPSIAPYLDVAKEPVPENRAIIIGGGPFFDASKLRYQFGSMVLNAGDPTGPFHHLGGSSVTRISSAPTYSLYKGSSLVSSGSTTYNSAFSLPISYTESGNYRLELNQTAEIVGVPVQAKSTYEFSRKNWQDQYASPIDSDPPSIKNIRLIGNGVSQSVVDSSIQNKLQFIIDPVRALKGDGTLLGDMIGNIQISMGTNGSDFTPLTLTSLGDLKYESAELPSMSGNLYHFKLEVTDKSGNKLTHTFQMPSGSALPSSLAVASDSEIPRITGSNSQPLVLTSTETMGCGSTTGTIDLTVSGGVPPYTYAWTGPNNYYNNIEDLSNLAGGTYNVTVSDSLGQYQSKSSNVPVYTPSTIIGTIGNNYSSISVNVSGSAPFTYSWSGPNGFTSTQKDLSGLSTAGQYALTVTNANGCKALKSFNLNSPIQLSSTVLKSCTSINGSSIDLTVTGGQTPYSYSWTGPNSFSSTVQDPSNLAPGNYTVTVTDGAYQTKTLTVPIETFIPFNPTYTVTHSTAPSYNNGSITASVTGGIAPYTFVWTPGTTVGPTSSTSNSRSGLSGSDSASYSLTIRDSQGCTKNFTGIKVFKKLEATYWSGPNCNESSKRNAIVVQTTGGHGPLTYSWKKNRVSFSNNSNSLVALPGAASYDILVTDSVGQTASLAASLPGVVLPLHEVTAKIKNSRFLSWSGAITVNVAKGIGPYTYTFKPGKTYSNIPESTYTVSKLSARKYDVTVKTSQGCSVTKQYRVTWGK